MLLSEKLEMHLSRYEAILIHNKEHANFAGEVIGKLSPSCPICRKYFAEKMTAAGA